LIIVNFPHNPTGYLPTVGEYQRIIHLAQKHNLYLFSDEMYRFLEYNPNDRLPSACELYEKAISLFGMSKTFGMAGVRIGWVVTKDDSLYSRIATFKDYTTICNSAPSEILSLIALRAKEKIILKHLARIQRNLEYLDRFFAEFGDLFTWVKPIAGTIAFPKIKGSMKASDFCQKVVREANIMLLPSTVYDYDDTHFRLGFGRENLPEALEKLRHYFEVRKE
jgi:aspartate/methionine/tyrosine aminotransferase